MNGPKSLLVKSNDNSKVEIKKVKVQKMPIGEIWNVKIADTIIFWSSSVLKINENVDLSQTTIDFAYVETNETASLNGKINGTPKKIIINDRSYMILSNVDECAS